MNPLIEMVCVINPGEFVWDRVLRSHLKYEQHNKDLDNGRFDFVNPITPTCIAKEVSLVGGGLRSYNLLDSNDQKIVSQLTLKYGDDLQYLMMDGMLRTLDEIKNLRWCEFVKITGGVKEVFFVDYLTINELHLPHTPYRNYVITSSVALSNH
jgi:hypothetical protein